MLSLKRKAVEWHSTDANLASQTQQRAVMVIVAMSQEKGSITFFNVCVDHVASREAQLECSCFD